MGLFDGAPQRVADLGYDNALCTPPDFYRDGAPVGSPNHASTLALFEVGLVNRPARWWWHLPWTGTVWLDGYQIRTPGGRR